MDQASFHVFYQKTAPALRAYAIRSCGSIDAADDIVQDAFLRFLRSAPVESLSEAQMRGYLYRTVETLIVDRWRRLQRETERTTAPQSFPETREESDVSHAFSQLDPRQRTLLWLAYVEDLDPEHSQQPGSYQRDVSRAAACSLCRCRRSRDGGTFVLGAAPNESIGLASIKDGRLLKKLNVQSSDGIKSIASSKDGTSLFYSSGGAIWSIPVAGGTPTKLGAGDYVSYDPSRDNLVVYLAEAAGVRLVRMPLTGGATEPIEQRGGSRLEKSRCPAAIRTDGQIVIPFLTEESWFLGGVVLDPKTGIVRKLPIRYDADLFSLAWNQKNEIVAAGSLMRSSIWRFQLQDR